MESSTFIMATNLATFVATKFGESWADFCNRVRDKKPGTTQKARRPEEDANVPRGHNPQHLGFIHEEDLTEADIPRPGNFISSDHTSRLVTRVAFETETKYFHVTSVVDTGCPYHLALSPITMTILKDLGIVEEYHGQDVCSPHWLPRAIKCRIITTLEQHRPKKLIGLKNCLLMGLKISAKDQDFRFHRKIS